MQRALPRFLVCAAMCAATANARADEFWAHWGDGKAELDGYNAFTTHLKDRGVYEAGEALDTTSTV